MPPAAVVVPAYQERKRIAAIVTQLLPACRQLGLRLIVSDGGSTDGTAALAQALGADVVVHRAPERQTISDGRNAGAAEAARGLEPTGVLLFFNADVVLPEPVAPFLQALTAAAHRDGAATCRVVVDPAVATLGETLVLGACNVVFAGMNLVRLGMGRGECHAVRRDVFEQVGGYNPEYAAGEDFDLYARIAQSKRAGTCPAGRRPIRFLWRYAIEEDPRRYRQRGLLLTMLDWFRNTCSITVFKRSYSTDWEAVR
jgi:glycosyltransferase involved in cell wall biosynthesis